VSGKWRYGLKNPTEGNEGNEEKAGRRQTRKWGQKDELLPLRALAPACRQAGLGCSILRKSVSIRGFLFNSFFVIFVVFCEISLRIRKFEKGNSQACADNRVPIILVRVLELGAHSRGNPPAVQASELRLTNERRFSTEGNEGNEEDRLTSRWEQNPACLPKPWRRQVNPVKSPDNHE
jgi:hypothetical protein